MGRPRLCTSVTNSTRLAIFTDLSMPNSRADLMALMVSLPPLARASACGLAFCACSRKEEKSVVFSGCLTEPTSRPPLARITFDASASSAWPKA